MQMLLVKSHPYSVKLNNSQQLAPALGRLDPNNSRALKAKLSRVLPGFLEISQGLDKLTQPRRGSHNRVDVRWYSFYCLNFINVKCSIQQYPESTACYRAVWKFRGRWFVWECSAARCSAASWSTVHLRVIRKQNNCSNNGGWNFWQYPRRSNEHYPCPPANRPLWRLVWTVSFSTNEQPLWRRNRHVWARVRTRRRCSTIGRAASWKLHLR